ncbi:MAG: alanine racemase [Bryobacteraceae bacterium]|jgi:alanine racemase
MEAAPFRSWAEVSRGQIAENFRRVRALVGPEVEIVGVVKADAYGHGAIEVSRVLESEGARWLAVSFIEEGVALREAGISARILVMADCPTLAGGALLEYQLTPVVQSLESLRELDRLLGGGAPRLRYHLKIDTGMGRLGTRAGAAEIATAVSEAARLELEGLMTHFASSADYSTARTDRQVRAFNQLCAQLRAAGVSPPYLHMSSTNPIAYGRREAWQNMVRPGHALYGYVSPARGEAPPRVLEVAPALTWKARVVTVKEVPEGALIGYGGMFRAPHPMRIAILALGYSDGLSHRLSNRGHVIAAGRLVPILGAISMDLTTIDVTESRSVRVGDAVTLLGAEGGVSINAQEMARTAGTISYDILCGIRARVKRVYV